MSGATALLNREDVKSYAVSTKSTVVKKESNGVSTESMIILMNLYDVSRGKSILSPQEELAMKFDELKTKWESDTARSSSVTLIAMHPAYQNIIGMGEDAIPLILAELKVKSGHWFWALKAISGEDPVLPEQRGRMKEMRDAWLRWGKEKKKVT